MLDGNVGFTVQDGNVKPSQSLIALIGEFYLKILPTILGVFQNSCGDNLYRRIICCKLRRRECLQNFESFCHD